MARHISNAPQNFGSSSSTKGPRGMGNCSWKWAFARAIRPARMRDVEASIFDIERKLNKV